MTGQEHFDLADGIMTRLREDSGTVRDEGLEHRTEEMARAQVHATLALAYAQALGHW